jgi:uncharacterized alpha-E superfamily protein
MSRYLERAEHTARLGDVCLGLMVDRSSEAVDRLMSAVTAPPEGYGFSVKDISELRAEERLSQSIAVCITAARENARQVREQVSSDMWEQLNRAYLDVKHHRSGGSVFYRQVKEVAHLFQGITDSTMTHSEGWHFIQIGRCIERAMATTLMLEKYFGDATEEGQTDISTYVSWTALLRSCSGYEAYCQRYTAEVRPEWIAEFLLLSANFPRSVRFAIDKIEGSLTLIAEMLGRSSTGRVDRLAGRLRASLGYSQIDEIMAGSLQSYLQGIRKQCELVHSALYDTYISYQTDSVIAR